MTQQALNKIGTQSQVKAKIVGDKPQLIWMSLTPVRPLSTLSGNLESLKELYI